MSFSSVVQFGVHKFGEKVPETSCGSPETEKVTERFLKAAKVALILVVANDPCVRVIGRVLESDKIEVRAVAAGISIVSEGDKLIGSLEEF